MLDEALPLAEEQGGLILVRVLCGLSWLEVIHGNAELARTHADRALEVVQPLDAPHAMRQIFGAHASIAVLEEDHRAALRYSHDALDLAAAVGDLEGQEIAHSNLGAIHHILGDKDGSRDEYVAALRHYELGREVVLRLGRGLHGGTAAANIAQIHIRLGDDLLAKQLLHEALTTVRRAGGTSALLFCVLAEADRRLVNGDSQSALRLMGMIRAHPARQSDNEAEIGRILGRSELPPDVIERGLATGADDDFEAVVDRLIVDLELTTKRPTTAPEPSDTTDTTRTTD